MVDDPDEVYEQRLELIKKHLAILGEHFDSIHIFAVRNGRKEIVERYTHGIGSWFERYGVIKCWVIMQEEGERKLIRDADGGDCV